MHLQYMKAGHYHRKGPYCCIARGLLIVIFYSNYTHLATGKYCTVIQYVLLLIGL